MKLGLVSRFLIPLCYVTTCAVGGCSSTKAPSTDGASAGDVAMSTGGTGTGGNPGSGGSGTVRGSGGANSGGAGGSGGTATGGSTTLGTGGGTAGSGAGGSSSYDASSELVDGGGGVDAPAPTFSCGPSSCTVGAQFCGTQDPSTYKDSTNYSCGTLPAGCSDCACLCPNGGCPYFPARNTNVCTCWARSSGLTVECFGE